MRLIPLSSEADVGRWSARYIADRINAYNPTANKPFVLGLPTGGTPLATYSELIALNKAKKVSFQHVITFNMDEYVGIPAGHQQSYRSFMCRHFLIILISRVIILIYLMVKHLILRLNACNMKVK